MSRKVRKNVGVIGLGIIGTRVAAGLRAGGFQVYVWNRSARPMPNFLGSPAEVAESSEIIQIFVSDAAALFDVIEAMADALTPQHIVMCNATVGPEAVLEAAQQVQARGAQFLDAPFTGSKVAAENRQLVYYVGGDEGTYLRARPVLEASSKSIVRIGGIGHAATVKVVTNMISAVTIQTLAEALAIVQKAGLEPEALAAALEHNACRSGVIDLKLPKMIAGDFEPHFSLKHMFKDVQLGIHMANALDLEVPVTTVTAGVMYGALNQGWADLDFSALYKNYASAETQEELPILGPDDLAEDDGLLAEPLKNTPALSLPGKETSEPAQGSFIELKPISPESETEGVGKEEPKKEAEKTTDEPAASPDQPSSESTDKPAPAPTGESKDDEPEAKKSGLEVTGGGPVDLVKEKPLGKLPEKSVNGQTTIRESAEPGTGPLRFVQRWFDARSRS